MDLADVRAAIAELDRQQKTLIRKRQHRLDLVARYEAEADAIAQEIDTVQDRWIALIQKEREIIAPAATLGDE